MDPRILIGSLKQHLDLAAVRLVLSPTRNTVEIQERMLPCNYHTLLPPSRTLPAKTQTFLLGNSITSRSDVSRPLSWKCGLRYAVAL